MSGGPPHHPHGRQGPPTNTAWNHLQVPNYYPRQPQHAHMSNEPSILHQQPTWHTPTTNEPGLKQSMPHHGHGHHHKLVDWPPSHYSTGSSGGGGGGGSRLHHQAPGVDLSLTTRNGSSGQLQQQSQFQNGEPLTITPISLSVRDTNKINSLPPSALEIQPVPPTFDPHPAAKLSPGLKSVSPGLDSSSKSKRSSKRVDSILERLNPNPLQINAIQSSVGFGVGGSSIPQILPASPLPQNAPPFSTEDATKGGSGGVTVVAVASSSNDENSNSSSTVASIATPNPPNDGDVVSPYSNDDSLDGNKSRRKRKPSKTVRVASTVDDNDKMMNQSISPMLITKAEIKAGPPELEEEKKISERRRSPVVALTDDEDLLGAAVNAAPQTPEKKPMKRKASSEAETIDDIAAMVQEGLKAKEEGAVVAATECSSGADSKPVSVIKGGTKESDATAEGALEGASEIVAALSDPPLTPVKETAVAESAPQPTPPPPPKEPQVAKTDSQFVEVENKLEEMFAGIEDSSDPLQMAADESATAPPATSIEEELLKMDGGSVAMDTSATAPATPADVSSTSGDVQVAKKSPKKGKRKQRNSSRRNSEASESAPTTPKKQKLSKKLSKGTTVTSAGASGGGGGSGVTSASSSVKGAAKALKKNSKVDVGRDVYAYDSGSNASSSRSKGPFIQIRGTRDSPLSVSVVNTPTNDDEERRPHKNKKFHDDSEYRHKVRSKGLHCSTLSNQYDAQTKDASWICAFCKRGPHATETSGPTLNGEVSAPGDLFGPYFITTNSPEFERRLDDPYDKQFKSKKITKALEGLKATPLGGGAGAGGSGKKKRKHSDAARRGSEDDIYVGITETSVGSKTYEIWAHEECIVWSQGTYLVGPKIVGLEEAVWTSCNVSCTRCHLKGANICCLRRGCAQVVHVCCAQLADWQFDESNYKTLCPDHSNLTT